MFKYILQFMNLKKSQFPITGQIQKLLLAVQAEDDEIKDELYLLIIKQTRNVSKFELKIKAIELMGIVASAILPTIKMFFPLLNFLENEQNNIIYLIDLEDSGKN